MIDPAFALPVFRSETVRFSCGCSLVITHELDNPVPDCSIRPCRKDRCPTLKALPASHVSVADVNGLRHVRPVKRGPA